MYGHPTSDLETFLVYLNETMHKINQEKRCCIIMGDFNLNLSNSVSHLGTEEFLNILGSNFFNPHILQPTRITHYSATLIDNVFSNSISHHTISRNIVYDLTDHHPNFLIVNNFTTLPKGYKMFKTDKILCKILRL